MQSPTSSRRSSSSSQSSYATAHSYVGWNSDGNPTSFLDFSSDMPVVSASRTRPTTQRYDTYATDARPMGDLAAGMRRMGRKDGDSEHCCGNISSVVDMVLSPTLSFLDKDVINAVLDHEFRGDQFYKLDSNPARRRGIAYRDRDGHVSQRTHRGDYPTLESVIDPLSTYFRILLAACRHVQYLQQLANGSHVYVSRLVALAARYEWSAVLAYHLAFYHDRLVEMKRGDFSGWAEANGELIARFLAGREKVYAINTTPSS